MHVQIHTRNSKAAHSRLLMFQTKQKPNPTLQFIGAETVIISISMRPASQKPVGELIPIGISLATSHVLT